MVHSVGFPAIGQDEIDGIPWTNIFKHPKETVTVTRNSYISVGTKFAGSENVSDSAVQCQFIGSFEYRHLEVLPQGPGRSKMLLTADVDWLETDGNYIRLHVGAASHLLRMTAAAIEPQLDPRAFIRVHRRYIVNVDRIVEVQPWFAGDAILILRNGARLRVSRTYRERLHARLGARS